MSARQFIALGTQSQAPTKKRNHHGGLLRWDDLGILFDPGEGTQRQLAHAGIAANSITHICITHFHGDHCLGLAGIVQRLSMDQCPHPVRVYFPATGQHFFERLRYASSYAERATLIPCPVDDEGPIELGESYTLSARRLDHRIEAFGYRLQEKDAVTFDRARLASLGIRGPDVGRLAAEKEVTVGERVVRIEDVSTPRRGQAFAFVMDTRPCAAAEELAHHADLLVMEATFSSAHEEEAREYAHCTAAQTATVARNAGVKRLVLTHFSQRYEDTTPLLEEARAIHPDVVAAMDLDVIDVPRRVRGA